MITCNYEIKLLNNNVPLKKNPLSQNPEVAIQPVSRILEKQPLDCRTYSSNGEIYSGPIVNQIDLFV